MSARRPVGVWESVPGGLWRLEAPGGWIYATGAPGDPDRAICFVPDPALTPGGAPRAAPLAAAILPPTGPSYRSACG